MDLLKLSESFCAFMLIVTTIVFFKYRINMALTDKKIKIKSTSKEEQEIINTDLKYVHSYLAKRITTIITISIGTLLTVLVSITVFITTVNIKDRSYDDNWSYQKKFNKAVGKCELQDHNKIIEDYIPIDGDDINITRGEKVSTFIFKNLLFDTLIAKHEKLLSIDKLKRTNVIQTN